MSWTPIERGFIFHSDINQIIPRPTFSKISATEVLRLDYGQTEVNRKLELYSIVLEKADEIATTWRDLQFDAPL